MRPQIHARVLAAPPREQIRPNHRRLGQAPRTKVALQKDGNQPRTKLDWAKTRWATVPTDSIPKTCLLEWVVPTQSYTVTELDMVGASDSELEQRIVD